MALSPACVDAKFVCKSPGGLARRYALYGRTGRTYARHVARATPRYCFDRHAARSTLQATIITGGTRSQAAAAVLTTGYSGTVYTVVLAVRRRTRYPKGSPLTPQDSVSRHDTDRRSSAQIAPIQSSTRDMHESHRRRRRRQAVAGGTRYGIAPESGRHPGHISKVKAHYGRIDPRNRVRDAVPEVDSIVMCIVKAHSERIEPRIGVFHSVMEVDPFIMRI